MGAMHRAAREEVDERIFNAVALGRGIVECPLGHVFRVKPSPEDYPLDDATRQWIGRDCPTCQMPLELAT